MEQIKQVMALLTWKELHNLLEAVLHEINIRNDRERPKDGFAKVDSKLAKVADQSDRHTV